MFSSSSKAVFVLSKARFLVSITSCISVSVSFLTFHVWRCHFLSPIIPSIYCLYNQLELDLRILIRLILHGLF